MAEMTTQDAARGDSPERQRLRFRRKPIADPSACGWRPRGAFADKPHFVTRVKDHYVALLAQQGHVASFGNLLTHHIRAVSGAVFISGTIDE
jgi:hypothetical protein